MDAQNEVKRLSTSSGLRTKLDPMTLPFSASINPSDAASQHRVEQLNEEVNQWKSEAGIYKAWVRQLDDAYNEEVRVSTRARGRPRRSRRTSEAGIPRPPGTSERPWRRGKWWTSATTRSSVIGSWPKHQHLEVWTSETVMAICLAANDGDRAAWEAWVWPALQPDADLDALNDNGGQRYQSIDATLSLALRRLVIRLGTWQSN